MYRVAATLALSLAATFPLQTHVRAQSPYTLVKLADSGTAHGINNRGQVAGEYVNEDGFTSPSLWQDSTIIPLGVLPDGTFGIAYGINDRGQIVGVGNSGVEGRGILWNNGSGHQSRHASRRRFQRSTRDQRPR
jgi:uncharacterized membrane protein